MKRVLVSAIMILALAGCSFADSDDESKQVCEPNSNFKEDCNKCRCSADGTKFWCTKMACEPTRSKRSEECVDGTRQKVDCNRCVCAKGVWACTKMQCPPKEKREAKQYCEPNSVFKQQCNTCRCNNDGTNAACTLKFCLDEDMTRHRRDAQYCEPNTSFKMGCNTCICNKDGTSAACTLRICLPEESEVGLPTRYRREIQTCTPKSVFKKDCNTCKCSDDGTMAFCTRRMCEPQRLKRDEVAVDEFKDAVAQNGSQVCTPGDVKTEDCNRCKCANNGIGWFCTRKACPPSQ